MRDEVAAALEALGWDAVRDAEFAPFAAKGYVPGRVAVAHRTRFGVVCAGGDLDATVTGRMRHEARDATAMPVVGDWVALAARLAEGTATIRALLSRRSVFSRKAAGEDTDEQLLAANIDVVFVMSSLNRELNLRRIERYLTMAWESGAAPVVVLTKSDLCDDVAARVEEVEGVALGVPVHPVSAVSGEGVGALHEHFRGHRTVALLGSSGVGKSTLVNRLLGVERQEVQEIRDTDDKGRHTTSRRELIALPSGGLIIDTPGMRELSLWDGSRGIAESFDDIEALAGDCRFTDCRHESEPGCAVLAAVAEGTLDAGRVASYAKLLREVRHLEIKKDARARSEERRKWKSIHKELRGLSEGT